MAKLKYKANQKLFTYNWGGGGSNVASIWPCTVVRPLPFITPLHDYIVRLNDGTEIQKSEEELFKTPNAARQGLINHIATHITDWHDGMANHARDILRLHDWVTLGASLIKDIKASIK